MANRLRQQQQQQRQQQQLQQHPQQQLHHPQQPQAPPQPQRQRSLPPSSELFVSGDRLGNINLPPNLRNSFQQQQHQLHLQNRVAQGIAQAAAAQSAVAGLLQGGVHGNGSSSNITATGSVAGAGAAPPSSTQPLPQGRFPPQGSGRNAFEHYSNVYPSAWGGGGAPPQSQQHRQWQQQQQQHHQQHHQQVQQLQQLRAGMRVAGGLGRGGGSEFVGGQVASTTAGRIARTTTYSSGGSSGSYSAVPSGTEVVEVLDDDRTASPPTGVDTNRQLFNQQQQRQQQQQQQRQQQREQQQRVVLATGVRISAVPQRREDRGLLRPLDEHLHPIMPATVPGSNSTNTAQRGHQPTGAALLRLLAAGQPHWYIGQEALPTGDCKTLLYIPELDRRPRMGVACESMSLKLLTGQARLVEALAGMYMKSINFFADEGRGEFPIPGAPQAFLPYERALYAAGMRDGDVVTLVDGLPATQSTLAKLGAKAHSQCSQPCVACVRLTFLRPVGASPTMPLASPQSVIDRWRELVRIIVLDSVPESPRKQEVLEQLERLQDASTLRTLACHSFEGQLEVARTNAGRRTRSSVPEQGPRQQQLQLQQPQQYVLNSNVSSSNPSSAAPAAPAAIATRPIVAQGGDHQQLRQQLRGVPAILSIGDNANSNANGHAGGSEGFLLGARAGADDVEQTAVAEAAPSAFVLRRLGSDKGSDKGGASRAGMGAREKVENGGSGVGEVGGHARGVERSSSAKEPSAREGAGGGDDNFSIAELAFVQEHWQDGVCTLHHLEDGVADGEVQGASGALALRRLVKCRGVDVKAGMTKAQLEADLRKAAKNGTLPDSGSFSFDIPEIVPAPSSQTQATVEAATASSLAVEGEEMEPSSSEQWCVEGQIVWVRGAFVAYMDGQAIEDNDVWCPGLVCVRMADPESGEGKGDPEAGSPGFVVDVLGQSQAEFEVEGDNLTGFPGHGENLETVRDSADSGLGSPPDHMSLAVGQAILACLKCGWDPQRGTNILRPTLCNDQDQGDARVKTYAKAWGIDPVKLEDLLKLSWQLMRPVPRGQESARRDHESGDWEHLRATWRKIERMWRGASSIERPSAGGSSSGGAKSVREAVLAEGVAADGSAEGKAAMPSGDGSREEEKGEGVRRNGGVAVATVMPSEEKGREGEEEEGGDAGGTRALSDKPRRSSPSQTGDGEATSPSFREGSESARKSDGGDRRGESKEIAEGASNSASAKDGGKGRPASPSAPAGSAGQGESSAADSKPLPSPFLLPPPPPPHPVGSSASDGDASGADAAGAAGAIETNRATVAAQGRVFSLPSDGAGVTGRTALKRSANEGKEGEEGGGAGQVAIERDAKRAKAGPTKSIEGSTARTASPGTTNSSSGGSGGSGSDAHSTTVTATGASSNAAGDATGDLEPGSKVAGEVGATAVTSVPGSDSSGGSYGLATMRNSIQAKGNGETASDGGGKQYALPTSTETVEAAAEKLAGPATAAGKAAAISKGADGFTTPAERAIAGADAPTPMTGSPASDDRARPTSGSQAGSKNKDVVSRPSGVPGEKAIRDPSSMPGGSHSPAAPPLPPRKISAASGEASGIPDGEKDRQQPWRGSAETLPRRGRKFETPPEFNENDFRDRTPRANGGHGVRVA